VDAARAAVLAWAGESHSTLKEHRDRRTFLSVGLIPEHERLIRVLVICELDSAQIAVVDRHLPLNRLDQRGDESSYLVAWEDHRPVAHARIAWSGTHLAVPEIQDVFVAADCRRKGIATALAEAAEAEAKARGWEAISLSVSQDKNPAARSLYTRLGYIAANAAPVRVAGLITLRGRSIEVDDTLIYMTKAL
jgi:GNAT superfamily N-acetyltransferase